MAKTESFDITTGCDLQEVDNALNQARREIENRYDFKGIKADIDFDRAENKISIHTQEQFHLDQIWTVLVSKFVARKVPIENMELADPEDAGGSTRRQTITLVQAIDGDTGRKLNRFIKELKLKKVQSQFQNDAVRVTAPNRDDLQSVIAALRAEDWEMQLNFGNYR